MRKGGGGLGYSGIRSDEQISGNFKLLLFLL